MNTVLNEELADVAEATAEISESAESVEVRTDSVKPQLDEEGQVALVEALLFACGEPVAIDTIAHIVGIDEEGLQKILSLLETRLGAAESGIELVCVASKYQLRTKSVFAPFLRDLKAGAPRRLSAPALETLSIIAYRQPIVKSDVEKIRGVDATPTLKTLIERNLIRIIGHQATVGQPALYGTTDEFLKLFGLKSLSELPTLRDMSELESDPGEVTEEVETAQAAVEAEQDQQVSQ